jgi:hypothetical protein
MKTVREECIEAGFVPGTHEYRKAYERFRWKRRSKDSRANCGMNCNHEYVRERMRRDDVYAEKMREKWRKAKERQRKKRGDEINAKQKEWYQENREAALESIKRGRYRRDPARGLATLLKRVERGDLGAAEFLEHARTAVDKLNSLGSGVRRSRLSGSDNTGRKNPKTERTKSGQRSPTGRPTSGNNKARSGSGGSENET